MDDGTDGSAEWDERYDGVDQMWSGVPNHALMHEVSTLRPGRAVDVGCGEGADAIWLASIGWEVTALDVAQVALDRARARAIEAGVTVNWLHAGLLDAHLDAGGFDLVSAQYPALRRTADDAAERSLIKAVAPGGTLLVVHHDLSDPTHALEDGFDPDEWVGPRDVARALGSDWQVEIDEVRERIITGGAGSHHTHDVVLRATRSRG